jgi:hypothetical protein
MRWNRLARADSPIAPMAASKRFGRYKKEDRKPIRIAELREDKALQAMMAAYEGFKQDFEFDNPQSMHKMPSEYYVDGFRHLAGLSCSSRDVERFSILLKHIVEEEKPGPSLIAMVGFNPQNHIQGMFLSMLVNNGADQAYTIHIPDLPNPMFSIGYRNSKELHVHGDVGHDAGAGMESGSMTVHGDAGAGAGRGMRGGELIIVGNAGHRCASEMKGGKVTVHGDADENLGMSMEGGEVHVLGNAGRGAGTLMRCGRIFIEGDADSKLGLDSEGGEIYLQGEFVGSDTFIQGDPVNTIKSVPETLGPSYVERRKVGASIWHKGWPIRLIRPDEGHK